ncbi:MAG: TIGR03751 family conjugal transfer lipoprotein [Acidobacteria bacterium]|nr:TIGR03751 family conjugal transfer lipoprotein [Acidobacteriota bacterium]
MPAPWILIAAVGSISLALSGCATTKEDVFPKDMKPMSEVYDDHFAKLRTRGTEGRRIGLKDEDGAALKETAGGSELPEGAHPQLSGYTREAHTEIEATFPVLPNPQLVMYVYPHLGEDGAPVPGYATAFPLYERVEYGLPGEAP